MTAQTVEIVGGPHDGALFPYRGVGADVVEVVVPRPLSIDDAPPEQRFLPAALRVTNEIVALPIAQRADGRLVVCWPKGLS